MESATSALRDRLSKDLSTLPGASNIACHVLATPPRKCLTLFPHTAVPSKKRAPVTEQDYLILLSQAPVEDLSSTCLISAAEIVVYGFPAAQASIVYVSKVDSTGQTIAGSSSPTGIMMKSILKYFTDPASRPTPSVRIQLFARAQGQYLFPDSSLYPGKRVLRDVDLCRWWKDVLTESIAQYPSQKWECYYLFPGFSQIEAERMLRNGQGDPPPTTIEWQYGHPYAWSSSLSFSTLTEASSSGGPIDIFDFLPAFADDPKARFLVELAVETNAEGGLLKPPVSKRHKASHPSPAPGPESQNRDSPDETSPPGAKKRATVSIEEFWERMGFREECNLSAVTGFFVVDDVVSSTTSNREPPGTPETPPGFITPPMLTRITSQLMNLDFGSTERARQATSVLVDSVKGLCSGLDDGGDYYGKHIAFNIRVDNPPRTRPSATSSAPAAPVNVLQVRKKKRPAAV